jgi:hypothetical protein
VLQTPPITAVVVAIAIPPPLFLGVNSQTPQRRQLQRSRDGDENQKQSTHKRSKKFPFSTFFSIFLKLKQSNERNLNQIVAKQRDWKPKEVAKLRGKEGRDERGGEECPEEKTHRERERERERGGRESVSDEDDRVRATSGVMVAMYAAAI